MDLSDPDSSLSSSADAVDSGTLPPIPEKPINQLVRIISSLKLRSRLLMISIVLTDSCTETRGVRRT